MRTSTSSKPRGMSVHTAAAQCGLRRRSRASSAISIVFKLCAGLLSLGLVLLPETIAAREKGGYGSPAGSPLTAQRAAPLQSATTTPHADAHPRADFGLERVSRDARQIADWIVHSADNLGLPFVIVDKIDARIFVFDAGGRLMGASAALIGSARGDDTVPGIGDREYADMPPETRTTPAGRFVAVLGMNTRGEDVVWVDYEAAVDIHRVVTNKPEEHRLARLATPTALDNRISYGCINVPARFYDRVVNPAFSGTDGIVYILPESRPAREVFGAYEVETRSARGYASPMDTRREDPKLLRARRAMR